MRRCLVVIAFLGACAIARGGDGAATSRPAITIGKDTTRITSPLKANGLPDYLAAINEAHSKDVTPENNAVVLLAQALGPEFFVPDAREEFQDARNR